MDDAGLPVGAPSDDPASGGPAADGGRAPRDRAADAPDGHPVAPDEPEIDTGRVSVVDVLAASRAIAPRRNGWLWANAVVILLVCVLAPLAGAQVAALVLAALLLTDAGVRLTSPTPPAGISIRSRGFDVVLLAGSGLAIGVLALTTPMI